MTTDDTIRIRRYADDDLEATVRMWHRSIKQAFPYVAELQRHTLEDDRSFFRGRLLPRYDVWVAVDGDEIVGMMAIEDDFIDQLYVAADRQSAGIGTRLLQQACRVSPQRLRLFTFQKNEPARRFYEKHGFRAVRFGVSPPPENEPDVEYEWIGPEGAKGSSE